MNLRLDRNIDHDAAGFRELVGLYAGSLAAAFEKVVIDMSSVTWLAADMCAPLGAILYRIGADLNEIELSGVNPAVEAALCRNGFLSHYGREKMPDRYGTTIPYQRFDVKDDRYFGQYIEADFVRRSEMPVMSGPLQKKFREGVFEIFSNAVTHSQTKLGIFSCGQFFPHKHRLVFAVADLGIGIRENVSRGTGQEKRADEAIMWATEGRNTTKRGAIPGGLGLKLLREFIELNKGVLRIVSDCGYWELREGLVRTCLLDHPFPGTVVNIEINTSDQQSYALASELSESDVF